MLLYTDAYSKSRDLLLSVASTICSLVKERLTYMGKFSLGTDELRALLDVGIRTTVHICTAAHAVMYIVASSR